jgi:hypothetical protein
MLSLERRIAAIEQKRPISDNITTVIIKREHGDTSQPMFVDFNGKRCTQGLNEEYDAFADRARDEALKNLPSKWSAQSMVLIARHPNLTREKWQEKHADVIN